MTIVLIVEKTGTIKEVNLKSYSEEELYKKAGFKSIEGFECQTQWTIENSEKKYTISLYAKTKGRAGQENKYDFPPPVDQTLYFGSCVLVNTVDGNVAEDLTEAEWEKIYEALFGGFEDIGSEDSEEMSEDTDPELPRTSTGYVKDGFVVEDNDLIEEEETTSEEEVVVKKKAKKSEVKKEKGQKKKKTVFESIEPEESETSEPNELTCTTELSEEEYV